MADWVNFFKRLLPRKNLSTDSITYINKGMPGEDKAELLRIQALARRKRKDLEGAIQKYNEAIACNPRSSLLLIERSEVRMIQGDVKGAMVDLEQAAHQDPNNADVYTARGHFRKKMGDEKRGKADLEKSRLLLLHQKEEAVKELGDAQSYLIRGEKKMEAGEFESALSDFNKALLLNPKEGSAYLSRGALKQVMGDHEGAKNDFHKAKECEKLAKSDDGFLSH